MSYESRYGKKPFAVIHADYGHVSSHNTEAAADKAAKRLNSMGTRKGFRSGTAEEARDADGKWTNKN